MPICGIYYTMGCAASQPTIKQSPCQDDSVKSRAIDPVIRNGDDTIEQPYINTNTNHNESTGANLSEHSNSEQITKKTYQKKVVTSTPLMHNTKNASQSQTDFFKMLDAKIEKGHDTYSEASVT